MALCLLCVLGGVVWQIQWLQWTAAGVLVADMIWPPIFKPFAVVWFGLADAIGSVTSRIVLSVVFFGLVTPVGLIRRWMGKDPMQLRRFGRDRESVFTVRGHRYTGADLERPY
ncbi:MAG: SxtJ family membrane protein [Acidobacteriota bacterium]